MGPESKLAWQVRKSMEDSENWFNGFGEHAGELTEGAMDGMREG